MLAPAFPPQELSAANGKFYVQDVGSTTGTFVFLPPQSPYKLYKDAIIKIANTEVTGSGTPKSRVTNS